MMVQSWSSQTFFKYTALKSTSLRIAVILNVFESQVFQTQVL